MSVYAFYHAGPRLPYLPGRDEFMELVSELWERRLVLGPWRVTSGWISCIHLQHITDDIVHGNGDRLEDLHAIIEDAPYGLRDIFVEFMDVGWEALDHDDYETRGEIGLYALTKPVMMGYYKGVDDVDPLSELSPCDEDHPSPTLFYALRPAQWCFSSVANYGLHWAHEPLDQVFARHFGEDFFQGFTQL